MNKKDMFIKEKLQQDKEISDRANKIFDNIKEEFKVENKEKKVIKISFNTFLAIAASLVIVGFVGVNLYANSIGKPNLISTIQALIKDEPEENTDEIAKELFEKAAYEIRRLQYGDIASEYDIADPFVETEANGKLYVKTNEKYETVEQKYAEIFTGEALEKVLNKRFLNLDGYLYVSHGGATGWDITNVEVEKINEENGELTYKASYNDVNIDDAISEEKYTCEFKIKEVNGEYRISATNYCGLDEKEEDKIEQENEYRSYKKSNNTYEEIKVYDASDSREPVEKITITFKEGTKRLIGTEYSYNIEDGKEYQISGVSTVGDVIILDGSQDHYSAPYIFIKDYLGDTYYVDTVTGMKTGEFKAKYLLSEDCTIENVLIGSVIESENGGYYYYGPQFTTTNGTVYHVDRNSNGKIELRQYAIGDNKVIGTASGADAMLDMLKYRNEEYGANYYYRLAALRNNNDGTYTATVDFYSPIFTSEENYNNMVNNKAVDINGITYTFSNASSEFNIGYGYITSSDGQPYCVEKQGDRYAFYREIGGVWKIIDRKTNSFEMTLNGDIEVQNILREEYDGLLEDCTDTLLNYLSQDGTITFEYSQERGEIYLLIDWR